MNLESLWAKEPVIIAAGLSVAATVGLISTEQASAVQTAITGGVAIVVQLLAAFKVRSVVIPPAHDPTPLPDGSEFDMDLGPVIS